VPVPFAGSQQPKNGGTLENMGNMGVYQHNFRLFHLENNSFLHCQHEDKDGQTKKHKIPVESPITESKKKQ